ncbi:HIRAN domain-containing protein [Cryobacterium sp. Y62]|uniref:HIRAN domain-containing protein n=1 Tax=Cryobacterium sp. Y62 TaxID=2048284 RepID=UPI000CE46B0B|nr:HIRAN domain-containing protein [Cryobacterium sp. Y62]
MGFFSRKRTVTFLPNATDTMPVAGVSYRQSAIRGRGIGPFQLMADPGNKFDENAVAVYQDKRQVGFVPADEAKLWCRLVKKLSKEGTGVWVYGAVRQDGRDRWILLNVPAEEQVRAWLKP